MTKFHPGAAGRGSGPGSGPVPGRPAHALASPAPVGPLDVAGGAAPHTAAVVASLGALALLGAGRRLRASGGGGGAFCACERQQEGHDYERESKFHPDRNSHGFAGSSNTLLQVTTLYRCKAPTDLVCRCGKVARRMRAMEMDFDEVRVPFLKRDRPEVEELSGQRWVPVLVHEDDVIHDSHRILEYLEWLEHRNR